MLFITEITLIFDNKPMQRMNEGVYGNFFVLPNFFDFRFHETTFYLFVILLTIGMWALSESHFHEELLMQITFESLFYFASLKLMSNASPHTTIVFFFQKCV